MHSEYFFYNSSKEYVDSIDPDLYREVTKAIIELPKLSTQSEVNQFLFLQLTGKGWSFDSSPPGIDEVDFSFAGLNGIDLPALRKRNDRSLTVTSSTLGADWHSDFAKSFNGKLVQAEVQFGKVESMFKDFCGFRIAHFERRLSLGIEIVMSEPTSYFSHRKSAISGMAYFDIAKRTLPAIGLDCPIWLVGIRE